MNTRELRNLEYKSSDLMFYEDRLKTYELWSSQIQPDMFQLSSAGFYYTGRNDTVECFSCAVRLQQWKQDDNPLKEHKIHSPNCLFLKIIGQLKNSCSSIDIPSSWSPWETSKPLFQYGDIGSNDLKKFKNSNR